MLLKLGSGLKEKEVQELLTRLKWMGYEASLFRGTQGVQVLLEGGPLANEQALSTLEGLSFVEEVFLEQKPFKLADFGAWKARKSIALGDHFIGEQYPVIIAGPCSVENEEQMHQIARCVSDAGCFLLRGGVFKPRTSPYSFQGLGEAGLRILREAADAFNLLTVSEVMDARSINSMLDYVDVFQVGSRNMQNFSLLKELGTIDKPVLLKRGSAATYQDLLMAAEYVLSGGNERVILCERGIRTFETYMRNTLDLAAVPALKELSHLPVIVDPSHATGFARFVPSMAKAAIAAGADGIIVEIHPEPSKSLSDKEQALTLEAFTILVEELKKINPLLARQRDLQHL